MAISYASNSKSSRKLLSFISSIVATILMIFLPSAAHAETAWRYWSYWNSTDGTWQLAMTGAADVEATDGSVQGWRYITAGLEVGDEFAPRITANFDDICGGTGQSEGFARVAVVIDFGDISDYSADVTVPDIISECVVVENGSPSSLLLPKLVDIRDEAGLICGINNLPPTGCAEEVDIAKDKPVVTSMQPDSNDATIFQNPLLLGGAAIAIAIVAFLALKKRS